MRVKCWVKDERKMRTAGFVPRCSSLNPGKGRKQVDGKVKVQEGTKEADWGRES